MWIWVTFWDLKAHALKGRSFTIVRGPLALAVAAVVVAITVGRLLLQRRVRLRGGRRPPAAHPTGGEPRPDSTGA